MAIQVMQRILRQGEKCLIFITRRNNINISTYKKLAHSIFVGYNGNDKTRRQLALAAGWAEPMVCPALFGSNFILALRRRFVNLHRGKEVPNMAFPLSVVEAAWRRSGGRCECQRSSCGHGYWRCGKQLDWSARGNDYAYGGWEAHHKTAAAVGGPDTLSNCEILCISCHKNTGSYGR